MLEQLLFCIDCAYYRETALEPECLAPYHAFFNLVDGTRDHTPACCTCRDSLRLCGAEGSWFEAKRDDRVPALMSNIPGCRVKKITVIAGRGDKEVSE